MLICQGDTAGLIYAHAEREYPRECCGIILGKRLGSRRIALRIIQTENMIKINASKTHFLINPLDIVKAEVLADDNELEVVGFYHSHTDYEALPSNEDIIHMIEGYSYPIVSVKDGMCVGINSFEKIMQTDTGVNKEEILMKEKEYADFCIHISNTEELFQQTGEA